MKLKYITFVLENCDSITIDGKYVGNFIVDNLHTSIKRIAMNVIERIDIADTFVIEICGDANVERYQFGQTQYEDFKQMTFDRLIGVRDITNIEFELVEDDCIVEDGEVPRTEHYEYCLNWTGNSDYINESQETYLSQADNLYIVVSEDKSLSDFFDFDEIDDEENMDTYFNLLDVGDVYGDPNKYDEDVEDTNN